MKKLKLFFACLLMAVLSIGQVWAVSPATLSFSAACGGSGTDSDGNTWTVSSDAAESAFDNTKGVHYGTSKAAVSNLTLSTSGFTGTITQIKVNASGASGTSAKLNVTVGGDAFGTEKSLTASAAEYTVTGSASGEIIISITQSSAKKALYCKSVEVTYTTGGVVDVESVSLNESSITLTIDGVEQQTLTATVLPENATNKNVSWESDDEDVATVVNGVVTAVGAGDATIKCKSTADATKYAECAVHVNPSPYAKSNLIFTAACEGKGTADDGAKWTVSSDGAESAYDATKGIHYGTSSAAVQYIQLSTSEIEGTIKKVVVNASAASGVSATVSVTVGGNAFGGDAQALSTSAAEYTFEGSAEGEIVVLVTKPSSATKAIYCKSIVVTYVGDGKEPAELAYAAADAQKLVKVGGSLTAPTLTNPHSLAVSYASSDEGVVKVNASTGEITEIGAAGKAVITASSAETPEYKAGSASYTIFVAEQAGTSEDPLTEASAKALIDLGCTLTAHVNGIIATATYNSTYHNYSVSLTNGVQFFRLKDLNNADFSSDYLGAGDEVTAVGQLTKYNTTYELAEGCYLTFYEAATTPLTPIANDEATAYTVEQALIYAAAPTTYDLSDIVYVRGKVAIASTALFNNKYLTYSISDDGSTTNVLKIYNGLGIDGAAFESKDDILVGDVVVVKGNLTQHNTELELAANNELVSKKPVATIAIDNMALEYAEEATISATITPAAAASTVLYSIKAGSDDVITLEGNKITAKSATGTATIVATIATTEDYEGTTKEFTVTVSEGDTRKKATLTSFAIGGVFDVTDMIYAAYQGDAANPVYISGTGDEMRLYKPGTGKTTGGYIVINAVKGCTIDEVIVYNGSAKATTIGCSTTSTLATSGEAYAKSASVSFKNLDATVVYIDNIGSDRMDIKKIEVFYTGDAAAVDHYELGGTYQTEFEIDDEFNHDGLVVYMAYDAGGTEKLEITPACTFSEPDMSVAGTPTVNITFAGGVVKTYDITVAASTLLDPELSYDPTSVTLTQGDALSAPTLNNPHTLDLTFNSNKTSVATVDEFGVIALAGGTGTATITASFAGDATYQAGNATFTITVNEPEEDLTGTWEFATSVAAGDRIIIASIADAGAVTTMGAQNGNNRSGVASTVAGTELTPAAGSKSVTLVDAGDGKFALQLNNGSYLYASSNSGNQLKETAAYADNENAKWTISISEGVATITAQGTNTHNVMRYNPNSGSPLFNCYTSSSTTGTLVTVYKKATPAPDYTRGVTIGNYGTICLPNGGNISGAKLFDLDYYDGANTLYLLEVNDNAMVAGRPYIFLPSVATIEVFYTDEENAPVGTYRGLIGSYSKQLITPNEENYILLNNQYWYVNSEAYVGDHRAYIDMSFVADEPMQQQAGAPRRRVAMAVNGENAAQGFENIESGDAPMKVMIDGTLYILRGEKVYDATGRLVK